ncbi:MAG: DegT/DnrJ/EryC1/StrS family aminotransferase [Planctomycetes bacterium]|nr:DegT/DnrJ/EryC1/StrS family aminotransferase [Planctomycetota bacterium]
MFDYREQLAGMREEILAAMTAVLDSGSLILGPRVKQFEKNFAAYLGAPGEAVGVANGTDAIAIALRTLDIGSGDEVLTVSNTAIPTVSAIRMAGATPVFCDVDPQTLLIDLHDAASRITAHTRAIVPVHLFGNAVDMRAVLHFARQHRLRVVEDCAQATGTTLDGQHTGTFGDVGCFSFYPTKNLGAYGDGGLCFTRDAKLAEQMRRIRMYGCAATYYSEREGVNSRLDELQAAVLDVKLRHLDDHLLLRRSIAAQYEVEFAGQIDRPRTTRGASHSYHLYVINSPRRSALIAQLDAQQIGHGIHYPTPIHLMRGYQFLSYGPGSLPVTEQAAGRILSLPCYPELPLLSAARVAAAVVGPAVSRLAA